MKKRIAWLIMALALLLRAAGLSEAEPDGRLYDAFGVRLAGGALSGYTKIQYIEPSGLLMSASSERTDITVSIEESEGASEQEYLALYRRGIEKYADVLSEEALQGVQSADGKAFCGMSVHYRHRRANEGDPGTVADVYAHGMEDGSFLVCVFRTGDPDYAGNEMKNGENAFFSEFSLSSYKVSSQYLAYLKAVREEEGRIIVTLDFCTVEYDASLFLIYSLNQNPEDAEYALRRDAIVLMPVPDAELYALTEIKPDAQLLDGAIREYRAERNACGVFQILMDENNEIIRMSHYNAF